jgi:hypothetical protein
MQSPSGSTSIEKHFQIAAQMVKARGGNFRVTLRFGKDERALNDRLRVQRQAFLAPVRIHPVDVRCLRDFQFVRLEIARENR